MSSLGSNIIKMVMEHDIPESRMIEPFIEELVELGGTYKEYNFSNGDEYWRCSSSVVIGSDLYIFTTVEKTSKQLEPQVVFTVFVFDDKIIVYGRFDGYTFYKVDDKTKAKFLSDIPAICYIDKTLSSKGIVGMSKSEYRLSLVASRVKSARN